MFYPGEKNSRGVYLNVYDCDFWIALLTY